MVLIVSTLLLAIAGIAYAASDGFGRCRECSCSGFSNKNSGAWCDKCGHHFAKHAGPSLTE